MSAWVPHSPSREVLIKTLLLQIMKYLKQSILLLLLKQAAEVLGEVTTKSPKATKKPKSATVTPIEVVQPIVAPVVVKTPSPVLGTCTEDSPVTVSSFLMFPMSSKRFKFLSTPI